MAARPWMPVAGGLALTVRLTPRGGRDALEGIEVLSNGRAVLRARVRAPPSEGEANAALIRLVARALGTAPRNVALIAGDSGRIKRLKIAGDASQLSAALEKFAAIG